MRTVFADSFYYIALLSKDDAAQNRAVLIAETITSHVITTAWIMVEVADALSDTRRRGDFLALLRELEQAPGVTILPPAKDSYHAGLDLYARRPDKDWSLTDCISFVAMRRYGLTDALTADRHFQQAGFNALLA